MMLHSKGSAGPHCTHPFGRAGAEGRPTGQNPLSAIHLWRIPLDTRSPPPAGWECVLTPDELARAARFRFAADRARWVRTRSIVRVLLGRYAQCPPRAVPLTYGAHGKPALHPGFRPVPLHFNWSHTQGAALLAVTEGGPVGVDIEQARAALDFEALAPQVCAPDELACLRSARADQRQALFFAFWTAKEAALKALGVGLSLPPKEVSVAALACRTTAQTHGLWVHRLPTGDGHAAALASPLKDPHICLHQWHDTCILPLSSTRGKARLQGGCAPRTFAPGEAFALGEARAGECRQCHETVSRCARKRCAEPGQQPQPLAPAPPAAGPAGR